MKRVFRVEFNGKDEDVGTITDENLVKALCESSCPVKFDEIDVTEIKPKTTPPPGSTP